jgi:hypothetical protein
MTPKELWIEALRSGKYKQTQDLLRTGKTDKSAKFCCLGVACDIYAKETGEGQWKYNADKTRMEFCDTNGQMMGAAFLPDAVRKWMGLRTENGASRKEDTTLTSLNDEYNYSFEQIADKLEANEGYWVDTQT